MDPALFETIVRESREMGAFRVVICGEGEPTLHPKFDRMLDLVTRLEMEPYVITNGIGIDHTRAKIWASMRAHFRFSIHAGDVETWLSVHPSGSSKDFENLSRVIKMLASAKTPHVSTMHVIHKGNYLQVRQMVEHAKELGVKEILFRPVRAEGAFTKVVLSPKEEDELGCRLKLSLELAERYGIRTNLQEYIENNLHIRSGRLNTMLLYRKIPCYIGWIYGEFDIDGTMTPCLNSERVMGCAGREPLSDIWHSQRYWSFRRESRSLPKRSKPVKGCKCDSCVMVKYNLNIYNFLHLKSLKYSNA
jgi:MoaA/NifB/PqqE/SkfB family radical SAM enzyme